VTGSARDGPGDRGRRTGEPCITRSFARPLALIAAVASAVPTLASPGDALPQQALDAVRTGLFIRGWIGTEDRL
jgi:hypothetical protein